MNEETLSLVQKIRTSLFDAEALLLFLGKEKNLQSILNQDSPEVVLKSMIEYASELVSEATGHSTFVIEDAQKAGEAQS